MAIATVVGFVFLLALMQILRSAGGNGFYAVMSHNTMVAIFLPAFLFPIVSLGISLRCYWRQTIGGAATWGDITGAISSAAGMRNLRGGHGDGCNFEDTDRFSHARRMAHHAVMYGFLLCFASTSVATIMHYGLGLEAPYPFWSLPKLLGIPGGLLLTFGAVWMLFLKFAADPKLGSILSWGGEIGFVFLLGFVAATGLALYWLGGIGAMPTLLAVHLGSVLAFFLLTPYSKMAHGFYRFTALVGEEKLKRLRADKS